MQEKAEAAATLSETSGGPESKPLAKTHHKNAAKTGEDARLKGATERRLTGVLLEYAQPPEPTVEVDRIRGFQTAQEARLKQEQALAEDSDHVSCRSCLWVELSFQVAWMWSCRYFQ